MSDAEVKHVFLSYVKEDKEAVDQLCGVLEASKVPYWRDKKDLGPGDAWKAKIREAIRDGSLVFLACFSEKSRARDKSYQNEELTLAVEEYRKMAPGRTWLIPVRFDEGPVPEWDLGAGRGLSDLNYSDLFGDDHMKNMAELLATIHRQMGEKRIDPATALAAVEQVTDANRVDLLRRMTKEMLLDPSRRIEMDDLISTEVQRVVAALSNDQRFDKLGGRNDEVLIKIAQEAQTLWELTQPFCASLQVAARYGSPDDLTPWAGGIRSFTAAAIRTTSGRTALLELRNLAPAMSIFVAALASVSSGKWANLKTLVDDPRVRDKYDRTPGSLLEATDPYAPFSNSAPADSILARTALEGVSFEQAATYYANGNGKYYTPFAEWMHHVLRPLFRDQWPDDEAFDSEFDRAEIILGVLAQDAGNIRVAAAGGRGFSHSRWFGRTTWRANQHRGNALVDLAAELDAKGGGWEPLRAGLFGGSEQRASDALTQYSEQFNRIASSRR